MRTAVVVILLGLVVLAGAELMAGPQTGTFKINLPGYSTQIFVTVPPNYKSSQSGKWGLIVGLHGAGQPPGSYIGAWPSRTLGSAGYVMVAPQSCTGGGVWNIDGKGDNAKECEYIQKLVEKIVKEYGLNPDMIHLNGFSAGSGMCGVGVAMEDSFRKFKQRSIVAFSGGFSDGMRAKPDKAKETRVRVYNGSADTRHAQCSRVMHKAFKDAGYDAEYFEVAGGHNYPLVNHGEIIKWYVELDRASRKKGEYLKLASEAEGALKDGKYAEAKNLFEKLRKSAGEELPELAQRAKKGLEEIEKAQQEALSKIEELKAAGKTEELAEFCKTVVKEFAKTDVADRAKVILKELGKASRPKETERETRPEKTGKDEEPPGQGQETAASLLSRAKRCIAGEAFEAARTCLEKILTDFPDSPESNEARKLLDAVEDEL